MSSSTIQISDLFIFPIFLTKIIRHIHQISKFIEKCASYIWKMISNYTKRLENCDKVPINYDCLP